MGYSLTLRISDKIDFLLYNLFELALHEEIVVSHGIVILSRPIVGEALRKEKIYI